MTSRSSGTIVSRLKKAIEIKGAAQVAVDLGERDTQAIKRWCRAGVLPDWRIEKVEKYLKGKKA